MVDPFDAKVIDDVDRAVSIVLIEVEDADPSREAGPLERKCRYHQPIEGAEAATPIEIGMVETGARRDRDLAIRNRLACGRRHCAARVGQRSSHLRQTIAEAVVASQVENAVDVIPIMRGIEILPRYGLRFHDLDRQAERLPRRNDMLWLAGAWRETARVRKHAVGVEDLDHKLFFLSLASGNQLLGKPAYGLLNHLAGKPLQCLPAASDSFAPSRSPV